MMRSPFPLLAALALGVAPLLALPGCATTQGPPDRLANERLELVLSVEAGYQVGAALLRVSAQSGILPKADFPRAREANRKAFRSVCLARIAYNVAERRDPFEDVRGSCARVLEAGDAAKVQALAAQASEARLLVDALRGLVE